MERQRFQLDIGEFKKSYENETLNQALKDVRLVAQSIPDEITQICYEVPVM